MVKNTSIITFVFVREFKKSGITVIELLSASNINENHDVINSSVKLSVKKIFSEKNTCVKNAKICSDCIRLLDQVEIL